MDTTTDPKEITQPYIGLPNLTRWGQTQSELKRLQMALQDWLALRYERDKDEFGRYQGLHKTRLDTLKTVLEKGLEALGGELDKVDVSPERSNQAVYKECRQFDQAIVRMERVWLYYREKFDQRDQASGLGRLLKAADEVVWSCYKQVFVRKDLLPQDTQIGPAPLSFVAPEYSPATWEADKVSPPELRGFNRIEGLESFLQTLPVPILSLPPWCLAAPWWLVFIAHEVGHNIQRELNLIAPFETTLERVCLKQGRPPEPDTRLWKRWSKEVFADLFSVMMLGPWAVRGMLELELAPAEDLLKRRGDYPAPAVRLQLLARAADRSGFNGSEALGSLDPERLTEDAGAVEKDMELVEPLLDAVLTKPLTEKVGSLEELCGLTRLSRDNFLKEVNTWCVELMKSNSGSPTASLLAPRFLIGGAMAAWAEATRQTTAEQRALVESLASDPAQRLAAGQVLEKIRAARQTQLQVLLHGTIEKLTVSGPAGVRAKQLTPPEAASFGTDLALRLLDAARQPGRESESTGG
jgi:hypothetical protein